MGTSAQSENTEKKTSGVACAGTQCIDRFWQGLDDFIPASVMNEKQGRLNTRLLTFVYSYMWRYCTTCQLMRTSRSSSVSWRRRQRSTERVKKKAARDFLTPIKL